MFPAQPPSFGKGEGHFIALLLYSDDAKPAGWFYQEEANKEFALENPILFIASMPLYRLCRWHFTTASGMVYYIVLQQSFKDRFQKLM